MIRNNSFWSTDLGDLRLLSSVIIIAAGLAWSGCVQSSSGFTPHDSILQQDPMLLWTKILSNIGIAAACFALFVALRHFIRYRQNRSHPVIFRLLGMLLIAFVLLHLMKIWGLYQPLYWTMASIEACTAAIALLGTIAFWPLVPKTLDLKGSEEFENVSKKLRESERHFHLLISGIKDYAIYLLDPQGTIMTWNEGAERINGYRADEIIGKNFACFFRPQDREKNRPQLELEMAKKNGRHEEEGPRVRKDGSQFWADIIITALRDDFGHRKEIS